MTVQVNWCVAERPLDDAAVESAVAAALAHGGRPGIDVEVVLVDDPTLAELHARFLGDPSPTDVMSFDLGEDGGGPAGELYVSVDRARAVASARGVRVARELALYLVHGTLHLCGHDDHEDDARSAMRAAERDVLASLGYEADAAPHDTPSA
jgi:probable rRNA maturation factor